jgi:predicted DNA-binding WGR domain protein
MSFIDDDTMPDWDRPPANFTAVELVRIDLEANARRYYRIAWEPTLLDDHAVIRSYGRKGAWQRTCITPFASLEAAWPLIRASLKTRLRHGYRVVGCA